MVCNKRTIQSRSAPVLDPMGAHAPRFPARCDEAVDAITDVKRNEANGQSSICSAHCGGR